MKHRQVLNGLIQITQLVRDTAATLAHVCVLPKQTLLTSNSYNCEMHFNDRENIVRQRWGCTFYIKTTALATPRVLRCWAPLGSLRSYKDYKMDPQVSALTSLMHSSRRTCCHLFPETGIHPEVVKSNL